MNYFVLSQANCMLRLNMGPKIETTRNPLGLGIYRNLILGSIFIFRIPNPESRTETYIPKYNRNSIYYYYLILLKYYYNIIIYCNLKFYFYIKLYGSLARKIKL